MSHTLYAIVIMAPPILFSIILHEISHGWVAHRLGDETAAQAGRLTLNPLPHIDPFGSLILPLMLIVSGSPYVLGWAKPVPVRFSNLRHPKRDMVAVAVAGPGTNLILALLSTLIYQHAPFVWLAQMALVGVQINVVLAVFNMLPILPLDGGRVLFGLLPLPAARTFARLEPYGMLILVGLLFTGVLNTLIGPLTQTLVHALVVRG